MYLKMSMFKVTPTPSHTQDREIASVSSDGYWITVTEPLNFTHHGVTEVYEDGQYIDIRLAATDSLLACRTRSHTIVLII